MYTSTLLTALLPVLAAAAPTANLQMRQTTSSDDILNGDCGTVNYIFARGTTEVGNLGTVIGPGFGRALGQRMGDVAVQGVDYPANVAGFLAGGSNAGADTMAELARQSISQCPGVPIVMSGYRYERTLSQPFLEHICASTKSLNPNSPCPFPPHLLNPHMICPTSTYLQYPPAAQTSLRSPAFHADWHPAQLRYPPPPDLNPR
jgi:hypothetical protein